MKMRNGLDFLQDEYLLKHVIPAKAGTQVYIKKIHHRIEVKIDYEKRLGLGPRFRRGDIFGNWLSIKTITLFLLLASTTAYASIQQTAPNNITFGTSASAPQGLHPAMYVGASARLPAAVANDPKTIPYKLSRISLQTTSNITTTYNVLQPFVSSKTTVNGTEGPHPLADVTSSVAQLAVLAGQYPVFTVAKAAAGGAAPTFGGLHLVTDAAGNAISSAAPLIDQEKTEVTAVPAALTAGSTVAVDPQAGTPLIGNTFVFAAVSKAGTQFDNVTQKTRGIAVMQYHPATTTGDAPTPAELKQIDVTNVASGGDAQALSVNMSAQPADGAAVIAFGNGTDKSIERAVVGRAASMAWDQGLERLYLGFTGARRNDPEKLGGVLGICMAYPEYTDASANKVLQNFSVAPFVDAPSSGLFSSALGAGAITEHSNPDGIVHDLPGIVNPAPAAAAFSVTVGNIQTCLKVLKAAIEYVRVHAGVAGNNANDLLAYLINPIPASPASAGIFATAAEAARFLSTPFAGQSVTIFGVDTNIGVLPANAPSDANFLTFIRTRFVQLLKNAKIVNQAYATGNFTNSVYTNSLDMIVGLYADGKTLRIDEQTGIAQARNDGDDDLAVSIPHLAVMNTSTGRPYLIAHSIMTTSPIGIGGTMYTEADNWVYALPLIKDAPNGRADLKGSLAAVTNDDEGVGRIALTEATNPPAGRYQVPLELAGRIILPATVGIGMPKRFHKAARVGGGNPIKGSWIKDIFVAGDAVYVALAGLLPSQQGVFKSTAIFDKDGCIINWTPATRVMGGVQQTFAAMLDTTTASFYALTQASPSAVQPSPNGFGGQAPGAAQAPPVQLNGATTAQITKWGKGQAHMHGDNAAWSLDAVLGGMFDQKKGGVHGLIPFDELTYGFPPDKLSLLMAYGFDSIAVAKTGEHDGVAFRPVKEHFASGLNTNVWNFSAGISEVKPVTCGAVVHNPSVNVPPPLAPGWTRFYVGGYQGLAMLEIAYPDSVAFKTNLIRAANAGGPFIPAGVPGVQAKDQIVAVGEAVTRGGANGAIDHRYLHVLTQNGVVVNEIPAANVAGGAFVPAHVVIANLQNVLDGVVLADGTLVATATGLNFVSADGTVVTPIPIGDVIPLQIQVLPSRNTDGLFELPATVYVLGMGKPMPDDVVPGAHAAVRPPSTTLVTQLWRIVVYKDVAGAVQSDVLDKYAPVGNPPIGQPRPYAQYPNLRLNFSADGSLLFDASSRDGIHNDFLRVGSLAAPEPVLNNFALGQKSITSLLDIDQSKSFRIGIPVRDAATGAWLVPGDWGLRVNE